MTDGVHTVRAVWFNNPRLVSRFRPGMRLALYGRVEYRGGLQLTNPGFEVLEGDGTASVGRIVPVYPLAAPLSQRWTRRLFFSVMGVLFLAAGILIFRDKLQGKAKFAVAVLLCLALAVNAVGGYYV